MKRLLLALGLFGFALSVSGADPGFAARSPFDPGAFSGGAVSAVDSTTDVAPGATVFGGANAYPQATVNTTGGNLSICPGIGRRLFTIVDYSLVDAIDTVTVTVNGSATVKTAGGTDWTAATSNAATATSLATAINTISGISATASGASVYLTPVATTCTLTLATSMDAGEGTATSGTDGTVTVTGATPQDATYWVSSANATLTAETNLGALTTGLVLNTVAAGTGTPSAYGGTSCTNQFPRSLNASGAATCASVANDDLAGSIAASKLVGTDIATVGTLTSGATGVGFGALVGTSLDVSAGAISGGALTASGESLFSAAMRVKGAYGTDSANQMALSMSGSTGALIVDGSGVGSVGAFTIYLQDSAGGNTINPLSISSTGVVTIPNLAGVGSRTVVVDANGVLSAP